MAEVIAQRLALLKDGRSLLWESIGKKFTRSPFWLGQRE
jgi:hypothetical protein